MARRKLKQTKAAKAARRRYRAKYAAGKPKHKKRGCGKRGWSRGGNARWKCKPGRKRHTYKYNKKRKR